MKSLLDWLDHRTGIRRLTREALFENIPGGSRWRYVWGSTLTSHLRPVHHRHFFVEGL
ncbi:MAG: hypothetical protein CM1200mP34_3380 [Verrucomicrobiales bacterium]|nr:MAG: hypothetical protein CM1200mP34_3380 [Verrucomicrobiales bacterium]